MLRAIIGSKVFPMAVQCWVLCPRRRLTCGPVQIRSEGMPSYLFRRNTRIVQSIGSGVWQSLRLEAELRRAQGGSAEAMLFSVLGAVQDFAAPRPLTDDMTLVLITNTIRE